MKVRIIASHSNSQESFNEKEILFTYDFDLENPINSRSRFLNIRVDLIDENSIDNYYNDSFEVESYHRLEEKKAKLLLEQLGFSFKSIQQLLRDENRGV